MLTASELRQLLAYDAETGGFTWRVRRGNTCPGTKAGRRDRYGYIQISIGGCKYQAHRLAWLYVHGEWPASQIDHSNGVKADNRIVNLRAATRTQNSANTKRRSNNRSGHKGICWNKDRGKWQAQIKVNGKMKYLGLFSDINEAAEKYRAAAVEFFGEFARTD